jgi:hypothetical protein
MQPPHQPATSRDVGTHRFQQVLQILADLEGLALAAAIGKGEPPSIAANADFVVRLLEVPARQTRDWTGWYQVHDAAPDVFKRLVHLSATANGSDDLFKLLALFEKAWKIPERAGYWTPSLQQAVLRAALEVDPTVRDWAIGELSRVETEIDAGTHNPHNRVSTWLTQAEAWAVADATDRARSAVEHAARASWGPGQHDDDRQLIGWLDWLLTAAEQSALTADKLLAECRTYASRLAAAAPEAEHHAAEASQQLIRIAFNRDAPMACNLTEQLCERGVIGEADSIEAIVSAAVRDNLVNPSLVAAIHTQLLLPIAESVLSGLSEAVADCDETGLTSALVDKAQRLWVLHGSDGSEPGTTSAAEPNASSPSESQDGEPPNSSVALLKAMRTTSPDAVTETQLSLWEQAAERSRGHTTGAVAAALVDQARRLALTGAAMGAIAALAAEAGELTSAEAALSEVLARTPAYGWLGHVGGGTRLKLFRAALGGRQPSLVKLAARDMAGAVAAGSLRGQIFPNDLRRFAELIGGPRLVASAWPDIREYLDEYAPAGTEVLGEGQPAASPSEALLRWTCTYLGHPVRSMDFGARAIMQAALRLYPQESNLVLSEAVIAGGWTCEAALLTLITSPNSADSLLSTELQEAVRAATSSPDAIIRSLARRLLNLSGNVARLPPSRPLSTVYQLRLPPLPPRSAAELDPDGTPYLDRHDPQHLVAPFDAPLKWLAETADLNEAAVLYHAASIASVADEPWTAGGHRAHAQRLRRRGNMHSYRPWAYMAGRRALGEVFGDLIDAGVVPTNAYAAYEIGLIDEELVGVELLPLDEATPPPWRPPGTSSYDIRTWGEETQDAAAAYVPAFTHSPYVLAELSEWRSLEWGLPEERRKVRAHHSQPLGSLVVPPTRAWEVTYAGAMRYPNRMSIDWEAEELVLHGHEAHSDGKYLEWLALHPRAAMRLGWELAEDVPFGWNGRDGAWRAQTLRKVRGQLSHQPPLLTYCAEVWQVVLSDIGRSELIAMFPTVSRTLYVTRTLPASRRESRTNDEIARAQIRLDS